jgi:hypothetical protein
MPQWSNDANGIYFVVEDARVLFARGAANVSGWSNKKFLADAGFKNIRETDGAHSGKKN